MFGLSICKDKGWSLGVLYIGTYSEERLQGLESSSLGKRRDATASIAQVADGKLPDLMYLRGDYVMTTYMDLPITEAASGLLKAVKDSGAWEDMMKFPEFDLNTGLAAINAVKSSYKAPSKN